jgi:IMP dehydrogenase
MVKNIIWTPGRTFSEFSLLTGYTTKKCKITNIDISTELAHNIVLKYPLMSAAMTSVTGYEMCLGLGKAGGIGILPVKISIKDQASIVRKIKEQDLSFVEDPLTARDDETIESVIRKIEQHGHSTIPVIDMFRNFLGMFVQEKYWETEIPGNEKVTKAMIHYDHTNTIDVLHDPSVSLEYVKKRLNETQGKYLVILDDQQRLVKIAFKQDINEIKVGAAISSYPGWKKRVEANIAAGIDMLCIDTSDAFSVFVEDVVKEYKSIKEYDVPLCVGNVITYEGAMCLMKAGADIIKVGMSSGSICLTQREKATGRAPMTALLEAVEARNKYYHETGKYVPIVIDGGVPHSAEMIIALTAADAIMMGGYFNHFYEAAAPKLDINKKPTTDESKMVYVETWGEGSEKARNLDRYGHSQRKTFFPEGVEGTVEYWGRLKPRLEKDMTKVKAALSNAGCKDLYEFRDNAVLELNSPHTAMIVSTTHDIEEKK